MLWLTTMKPKLSISLLVLLSILVPAYADVRLPAVIASDMVLQRDRAVPIWGWADSGESVTVSFAGQTKTAIANADGTWRVALDPLPANSTPASMTIAGKNKLELTNILVGEVWVCSGQSNMDWKLPESANGAEATAQANHPQIRLFFVPRKMRPKGNNLEDSLWRVCTPESARMFSAAGYYFGVELQKSLEIPVGLIHSSWGGTQAEAWTPTEYLLTNEILRPCVERSDKLVADRPRVQVEYDAAVKKWEEESAKAKADGKPEPRRPAVPDELRPQRVVASLWHGMLEPVVPFAIRGAVWYQGESNEGRAEQYKTLLPTMIKAWRDKWGQGDFPFGIVQLPNFRAPSTQPEDSAWSHLRDAQLFVYKSVPNTGLIVTIDIGEANDIHPKNKLDVGKRMAAWALADVYGKPVGKSGPIYASSRVEGNKVIVKFDQVGDGLKLRSGEAPGEFSIVGPDRVWRWADAKIVGSDTVEVWSDQVPAPLAVRYAWNTNPTNPNLTNSTGLPASPFRTDNWPGPTDGKR